MTDPFFVDLAQRAREFGALRDADYAQALAIAGDYGSVLADWHQLHADLVGKHRELLEVSNEFADQGQLADASRLLAVASGYESALHRMNQIRPVRS